MAGNKRKREVDESALSEEERERRRLQKELQILSKKLRDEGKEYKPQKHKRKVVQSILSSSPKQGQSVGVARREKKKQKTEAKRAVRVVVLPIFWEQKPEESKAVKQAAEEVAFQLQEALGVRVVRDDNNDFTPGERMKHWEELKVPVRVEIGPNDVKRRSAVVAIAGEPGTVAKKKVVGLDEPLLKHVWKKLTDMGIECKPLCLKAKANKEEDEKEEEEEEEGPNAEALAASVKGGDDMDDFDLDVDPEEETLTMSRVEIAKKKRKAEREKKKEEKRASRKEGRATEETSEEEGEKEEEVAKTKKKSKVVKF